MKTIPLTRGRVALVDDADFEWLNQWKWMARPGGKTCYAHGRPGGGKSSAVGMHRVILQAPKHLDVDHIDGNGLNNQRANLRLCTPKQNMRNQTRNPLGKSSRFKGVSWRKSEGKWSAQIRLHSRLLHLGYFKDEVSAAHAYDRSAVQHFGEFAHPNFPQVPA